MPFVRDSKIKSVLALKNNAEEEMKKPDDMPLWVFLAFSSVETRKVALMLVYFCVASSLYCFPWAMFFAGKAWVGKVFLLHDWTWFVWMLPTTLWYGLSLLWMDRHSRWGAEV